MSMPGPDYARLTVWAFIFGATVAFWVTLLLIVVL